MSKITDIVDDGAFKQLERLLNDLSIAQSGFLKVSDSVEEMNKSLAKTSGLQDLHKQVELIQKSNIKMEAAAAKVTSTAAKAAKAEDDLVKTIKEKIIVTDTEIKSLNKYTNSIDSTIKIQAKLKAELDALKKEQKDSAKEFEKGAISADIYSTRLGETAKRELELKDALKIATDSIKKQQDAKLKAIKIAEILANSEKKEAEAAREAAKATEKQSKVLGIINKRSSEYVKAENDATQATQNTTSELNEKAKVATKNVTALDSITNSLEDNIRAQIRLKLELKEVRAEQNILVKETAKGEKVSSSLANKTVELTAKEVELREALRQTNLDIRRTIKEVNAVDESYDQLTARLDRLRGAYKSLNNEEKANPELGGMLKASITELDEELKKQDASMGIFNRNVGNYESALSGLPGPIGEIIGGFDGLVNSVDTVNDSIQQSPGFFTQFTDGLKTMAKAAWAFIATPIGATIAAVSAGLLAAKGWYEYNKNLVEATRLTKQLTGMEGAELKNFRSEVQATADVFDKEYKEVLIASNSVAKQFGISQKEALDIVNKGFIAGADASGEYLDQLREYPSQLRAVGLSAEETAAIITQNVKDGIYSDKGIDAIKEAGIRIREMTPATQKAMDMIGLSSQEIRKGLESGAISMFEVIQQVSSKLGELPENSVAVGTALADIFGGPGEDAGIAYIKTLATIDTDLDSLVNKTGDLGKAQRIQLEATAELNKAWAALFDSTGGAFEMLIANGKLFGTNILLGIINGVIDLTNYFIDLYNTSATVRGSFELIGATFKNSYDIVSFLLKSLLNAFQTVGKSIGAVLSGDVFAIGSIVSEGLAQLTKDAVTFGKDFAGNYVDAYNNIIKNATIEKIKIPTGVGGGASAEAENSPFSSLPKTPTPEEQEEYIKKLKRIRDAEIALQESRLQRSSDRAKTVVDDSELPFEDRISNLEQYLEKRKELIKLNKQKELSNKDLTKIDLTRIEEETQEELLNLKTEGSKLAETILKDQLTAEETERAKAQAKILNGIEKNRDEQLLALNNRQASGSIESEKAYANERLKIQQDFTKQYVNAEMEALQAIIDLNKAKGLDVSAQEKDLAALRLKLSQSTTDKQIEDIQKVKAEEEELNNLRKELGNQVFELGAQLITQRFDTELQALDKQAEKIEENKQKDLDRINSSVLNEEEKAKRIAAVEMQAQKQHEALETRQRQVEREKAKFEKAAAIAKIIAETAIKVIEYGLFTPQAILAGSIGAVLLGKVISTKIPEYAKGVERSSEGPAIVGELGHELRIEPDGSMSMTENKPSLTWLKEGTKIVPSHNVQQYLFNSTVDTAKPNDGEIHWTHLINQLRRDNKMLLSALKGKTSHSTVLSKSGLSYAYKSSTATKQYLNRNLS